MIVNPRSNKESRISLIVDIMGNKQTKEAGKGDETGGFGDSQGGISYDMEAMSRWWVVDVMATVPWGTVLISLTMPFN
jgi:hypothetical protein